MEKTAAVKFLAGLLFRPGRGAVWLARLNGVQEVAGSNPVAPTFKACRDNRLRQAFLIHLLGTGHALGTDRAGNCSKITSSSHHLQFERSLPVTLRLFHKTQSLHD